MEPEDLSVQDGRSSLANCNRKESVDNVRDKRDDSSFHEDFFTAQINFLNPSSNALEPEQQLNIAKFRSEHSRDNEDVEQDEAVNMMMVNNIFNPNDVKNTLSLERNAMEQIEHCSSVQTMKNEREHSGLDQIHVPVIIHSSSVREIKTKRQQDDLEQVPVVIHNSSVQGMKRKREHSSLEQNCEPVQVPMVIQYSSVRDVKNKIEHSVLEQNKLEQVSVPTVITDNVFSVNGVQKANNDEEQFKMNTSELEAKINGETQMETDNDQEHQLNNDREDQSESIRERQLKINTEHRLETNIENTKEETCEKNVPESDTDSESESYPKREELILPRTESKVYEKQQLSPESDTDGESQNHVTREELILPSNSYEKQQLSPENNRNDKAPLPSESNGNEKAPLPSESNINEKQKLSPESDHYEKELSPVCNINEKEELSPESDHYEKQQLSPESNGNEKQRLFLEHNIDEKEPLSPESIRNEKELLYPENNSYEKQLLSLESISNEKQQRTPESIINEKEQLSHESNTDEKAIVEKAQLSPNFSIDEKGEDYDEQLSPDTNTDEKLQLSPESNCTSEHQRSFEDTESTHRELRIENTFHQEEDDEIDEESNGEAENEEERREEFSPIPTHIQPDTSGAVPTAETKGDLTTGEAEKISTITTTEDPKDDNGITDEEQDKTCGHCKQTFSSYLGLFRHTCPNELIPKKKRKYNKTIRTCKTCQAQFKSLNNYRKHVLDCWRKHPPPKKTLEPDSQPTIFADYEIKTEPLEVDSDDTIMLDEENDVQQSNNNNDKGADALDDISHYSSHIINRDLIPKPKIIEVAIKKESGPKKGRGRPKSKVKPERLPLPETHCPVCGVRYKNLKHYNVHKKRKIPCQPPPYDCKTCQQVFMTSYNLFYHQTKGNCTATVQVPAPIKRKRPNRPRKPKLSVEYIEHDDDEDSLFDFLKDDFEDPAIPIEEPTKIIEEPTKVIEEPAKPIAEPNEKPRPRVERRERPKPKSKKRLRQTDFALELDYDKPPITEQDNKKPSEPMEEFQNEPIKTQPQVKRKNVVQNEVAKSKPNNKVFTKSSPTKPRVTTKILSCGLCDSKFLFGHLRKRHYEKYHKGVSPIDKDDDEVIPAKKDRKYKRRLLTKETRSDTTEEQTSQVPERSEKLQSPIPPKEKQTTTTSDSSQLQLTLRSVTAEPPTVSPPKADEKIDVSIYLTPNGYECPMCSNFFKFPCRLREHLDRKTPCKPLNTEELDELGGQEIVIPKPLIVRKIPGKGFKRLYQMEDESPEDTTPPKTRVESGIKTPSNEVKKTVKTVKKVLDVASTNTEVAVKKKVLKATPSTQQTNKNSDETQDNSAVKPEKVSKALCKICNKVFPSVPDCYEHCLKFHNGKNETDKVKNNKDTSKETTVSLPVRKLTSPTEREKLKITIKSIKKEEDSSAYDALVNCPICLKQFVIIKARNTHLKSAHKAFSEERVMKFLKDTYCKKCKEYFGTPKDKYKHVEDVHGETPKPPEPIFTSFRPPKNTCVYCDGDFPSKTHLNTHMLRCQMKKVKTSPRVLKIDANQDTSPLSKDTGYKCTHCDIKFNSLTLYKAHANRFCPKRDEIKTIKSKDFKQELFGLDDIVFLTCEMCSAKFNKRLEFDIHVKELCPSRPSPTKPPGFGSPRLVTKPKPPEETTVVSNPIPTAEVIRRTPTMKPYIKYPPNLVRPKTCDTCCITFPTLLHYASHKRRCKDVIDPNNPPPPKRPRPSKARNNFVKRSDCLIAKKSKRLLGPVKTAKYNPRKSVKCNICYKTFSEIFTLSRHMRTIHLSPDERTMFICILCNSKFQNPRKLTRHYQDCHPESLKFQCGKCNKRYATNTRCVQHIRKQHGAVQEEIKVKDLDDENQEPVSTTDPVDKVEVPTTPTTTTITAKVTIEAGPEEPVLTADEIAQILTPPDAQKSQPTPKKVRTFIKTPSPKGDKTNEEDDNFYTILDDTPGRGLYCCDVCNVSTFTKINALRRHWKTKPHKENAEKHRAELKQRAAIKEKPGVLDSKGNYSGQKLSCSVCFKAFFSITAFVRHRLRHFNAQQMDLAEINIFNPYVCEICHKLFSHHQRVQTHLLWHMKTNKSSHASSKTDLVKLPETTERQPPGIPKIVEKIKVPQTLDKFNAKKTIGSRAPVKTSTLLEPTHYSCDQCSEVFLSKYLFSAHIRHTCPKRLNCPYCSVLFPNKKATLDHMEICKDKGELTCRFCFLKLESVNDLGWHEKGCVKVNDSQDGGHSNEDHVLQCFWCKLDICAVEGDYVQLHMNMHEDQDIKMSCRICDIAFADKTEIYEHMNELSHLGLLPNAKVNGGGDGGHSWNSLDPTEKNGDVSTVDTDNLGSDTIRCGSNDVKKVPKDIKPGVIYSPWLNDDNKRLRTKFAQLMYLLISDAELLSSLGWGSRAIDNVLKDILVYFGHMPRELYLTDNNDAASQEMEVLRSNIKLFLSVCIKDDLLVTDENETIDGLVTRILSVCTSNNENQ